MKQEAHDNRSAIEGIRHRLNRGTISYDQAIAEATPIVNRMNTKAKELAKTYGMKYKPFSIKSLLR